MLGTQRHPEASSPIAEMWPLEQSLCSPNSHPHREWHTLTPMSPIPNRTGVPTLSKPIWNRRTETIAGSSAHEQVMNVTWTRNVVLLEQTDRQTMVHLLLLLLSFT